MLKRYRHVLSLLFNIIQISAILSVFTGGSVRKCGYLHTQNGPKLDSVPVFLLCYLSVNLTCAEPGLLELTAH